MIVELHAIGKSLNLPPVQVQMKDSLYAKVGRREEEKNRKAFSPLNILLIELEVESDSEDEFVGWMKLKLQRDSTSEKSAEKEAFHLMGNFHVSASNQQRSWAIEILVDLNE